MTEDALWRRRGGERVRQPLFTVVGTYFTSETFRWCRTGIEDAHPILKKILRFRESLRAEIAKTGRRERERERGSLFPPGTPHALNLYLPRRPSRTLTLLLLFIFARETKWTPRITTRKT